MGHGISAGSTPPSAHERWVPRRRPAEVTGAAALLGAAMLIAVLVSWLRDPTATTVAFLAASGVGIGALLVGIRRHRPATPAIWWLCVAATATVGLSVLIALVAPPSIGQGPLVDLIHLIGFMMYVLAGFSALPSRGNRRDLAAHLDALTVAASVGLAFWYAVVTPRLGAHPPTLHWVVRGVLWPVLDLSLVVVLARLLATRDQRAFPLLALWLALACSVVTDVAHVLGAVQMPGGLLDGLWVLLPAAVGAAGLHPDMRTFGDRTGAPLGITGRSILIAGVAAFGAPLAVAAHAYASGRILEVMPVLLAFTACLAVVSTGRSAETVRQARLTAARLAVTNSQLEAAMEEMDVLYARAAHQAQHDPLTGLANRAALYDRLKSVMADRRAARSALLFVDLDDFKILNDTLGHQAGDQLLVELARRLTEALRPADLVARLGGDEFAVLLDRADHQVARALGQRLLSAVAAPYDISGRRVRLHASVGLAWTDSVEDPDQLIRYADLAMYQAKREGKNQLAVFDLSRMEGAVRSGEAVAEEVARLS